MSGVIVAWPRLISSMSGLIESMAMANPMFWAVSMMAVLMATTWPSAFSSGPPELPGLMAASVWMRLSRVIPWAWMLRSVAEMMPSVTLGGPPRLSALPMATTSSPTRTSRDTPSSAGVRPLTSAIWISAMSSSGRLPTSEAASLRPSDNMTSIVVAEATTWALVSTSPSSEMITPEPADPKTPVLLDSPVWIDTTDGWALLRSAWMSRRPPARRDEPEAELVEVCRSTRTTIDAPRAPASSAVTSATARTVRRVTESGDPPAPGEVWGRVGSGGSGPSPTVGFGWPNTGGDRAWVGGLAGGVDGRIGGMPGGGVGGEKVGGAPVGPGGVQSGGGVGGPPVGPCGSSTITPFRGRLGHHLRRFAPRLGTDGTVFATE